MGEKDDLVRFKAVLLRAADEQNEGEARTSMQAGGCSSPKLHVSVRGIPSVLWSGSQHAECEIPCLHQIIN